jgi:hypothetical protein
MQFIRTFALAMLFAGAAFAQTPVGELRSKLASIRYAPLAEAARVQGDVHLRIDSGVVTLLSGPPLLAQTAIESAKAFGSIQSGVDIDLTYHFVLAVSASSVPTLVTVKRGNAFGRAMLRMFGIKTEKVVVDYRCEEVTPPANDLKISGLTVEIWIYGRTRCLMTAAATLIARR